MEMDSNEMIWLFEVLPPDGPGSCADRLAARLLETKLPPSSWPQATQIWADGKQAARFSLEIRALIASLAIASAGYWYQAR